MICAKLLDYAAEWALDGLIVLQQLAVELKSFQVRYTEFFATILKMEINEVAVVRILQLVTSSSVADF